jgi:hypothetical protein
MKKTVEVLRELAGVLVGRKTQAVIEVNEESKPALEAFLSDVHRKYSAMKKETNEMVRRPNPKRGQTKLTLDVTLRCGREQIQRKVTVNYPKKLYAFELKREITGFVVGFKTMVAMLEKAERERRKMLPLVFRSTKLKRRRRSGTRIASHT